MTGASGRALRAVLAVRRLEMIIAAGRLSIIVPAFPSRFG
jgi:hypothetical protein